MSTIDPRTQAARQRIMNEAREMLARTKPFDAWVAGLSEAQREMFTRVAGSLEDAYWPLVRELERQAAEPSPNVAVETEMGIILTWQ